MAATWTQKKPFNQPSNPNEMNHPLYDLREAAQYLRLSTHGVRYAVRNGYLNKLQPRPGSKIRFTKAMLDAYLSGNNNPQTKP